MKLSLVHWLIAAALVGNAAVYFLSAVEEPAVEPEPLADLRSLKLLSELEQAPAKRVPAEVQPAPAEPPAPVEAIEPEVIEASEEPDLELAGQDSASSPELPEPELVAAVPAEAPVSDAASAPEAQADLEPEPEPEPEPDPDPEPLPAPQPPRCWLAGPVESDALSEQLAARFAGVGVGLDLVLRTVEVSPDHWVYLPTSGTQSDVRRLSRELRQSGYDNFQITDGPLAGSLSLGLFRSEERAEALRDQLRARGHQVEIYLRSAYREQPWAAIDDSARTRLDWPDAEGEIPGYDALELVSRECPDASDD